MMSFILAVVMPAGKKKKKNTDPRRAFKRQRTRIFKNGVEIVTRIGRENCARIEDALCHVAGLFSKLANSSAFRRLAVIDQTCGEFCGIHQLNRFVLISY
jgi:hypothetical protein